MGEEAVLARLIAQAETRKPDMATLTGIVEQASELGANRALARLGLADEGAHGDLTELRQLLRAWRDAKRSAWKAALGWVVRMALALMLVGLAVRLGFGAWVR